MSEMIKVSDYIFRRLADHGVRHVFLLTGGGAMHLNDSLRKETRIEYICNHHEQACAMAAEGYARVSGQIGVVCVTTGPGGTNALTGVLGQWLDSIPALYISGQVRYETTVASTGLALRQLGDQEGNIVASVKPITKYAVTVTDPQSIRYHVEKALYRAQSGRPGPVWLEIPLNVQGALVDPENLPAYDPAEDRIDFNQQQLAAQVAHILERIKVANRPVILAGAGIRLAGAAEEFHALIEQLEVPVLTAWNAIDLMPSDHPLFYGRPSTLGQRGANFIFQNADLLLNIGCRLNVRQIGYNFPAVARAAYKISVDIDPLELKKPTIKIDFPVHCDAKLFLKIMNAHIATSRISPKSEWLSWCKIRADRYPVVLPEYWESAHRVNPYVFVDLLSRYLKPGDVMVSSNGAACVIPIQALRLRDGQRHLVNSGCAAMGYGLPAAIGACFAHDKRQVICFEGDGSLQLNIQEMQTIVHHRLPLKIFVFNNGGYLSIRTTQEAFFNAKYIGESPASGVSFPDLVKIGTAYGINSVRIQEHRELAETIPKILETPGPILCDVLMPPDQSFAPRASSQRLPDGRMISKPLEDLAPFLDRDEFLSNMIIPPWDEGHA
ncbi:MAG TPA: thiamine pyrophosphate-binding protein [Syntrophobacteria bacterium]|nr:thiamine pyrophosphate-binding protein [Syntrophobacteria bacterium]